MEQRQSVNNKKRSQFSQPRFSNKEYIASSKYTVSVCFPRLTFDVNSTFLPNLLRVGVKALESICQL